MNSINWQIVSVTLAGVTAICSVLFFALRSFIRAELAEQRVAIMRDINGTYARKETVDLREAAVELERHLREEAVDLKFYEINRRFDQA